MTTTILALVLTVASALQAAEGLAPGRRVERRFAGGDVHRWTLRADAGQFVQVVVEQLDVDVVAALIDPAGRPAGTFDTPNGERGRERVRFVAAAAGDYTIELRSLQPEAAPGRYTIEWTDRRAATDADRRVIAAIAAQAEAARLRADAATRRDSLEQYDRAIALWRAAGDPHGEADALRGKGFAHVRLGEDAAAYDVFARTRELWRAVEDTRSEAFSLLILGTIHTRRGEAAQARDRAADALPLWRRAGDATQEAFTLGAIGAAQARLGDRAAAERAYGEAQDVARRAGRPTLEAAILDGLARTFGTLKDDAAALAAHERARTAWRAAGHRRGQAGSLRAIGAIHEARGDAARAIDAYAAAADLWRDAGVAKEEAADRARVERLRQK